MKYFNCLIVIMCCLFQLSRAQNIELDWVIKNGGTSHEQGYSLTVDDFGNVYSTGYFTGTVDFDPGLDTVNLTSIDDNDVFIQKLSPNGELIWVKQFGGSSSEVGYSVKTDSEGNVYFLGNFIEDFNFDTMTGASVVNSLGQNDVFIIKLDSNGTLLWNKHIGGTKPDYGRSVEIDLSGNIYITGGFDETVDFDPGLGVYNLTSVGDLDIFILKLNSNGDFIWAKSIEGSLPKYCPFDKGLVSDSLGNIYFTGYFIGTIDSDPGPAVNNLSWTSGGYDVFLEKLDSNGNFVWVQQMGGFSQNRTRSINIDQFSNIYLSGNYHGTVDFDPSINEYNLTSENIISYIQKFDSDGQFIWLKEIRSDSMVIGTQYILIESTALDNNGNLYSTGYLDGTFDFDPNEQVYYLNSGNNSGNIFIQKLNNDGQFLWATQYVSENYATGMSIIVDEENKIYSLGEFRDNLDSIDFDPSQEVSNLISNGGTDIFIQKLSQCIPTSINPAVTDLTEIQGTCQLFDSIIQPPLAYDNCGNELNGIPSIPFPITDQSISQITWLFEDPYGNSSSQNQNITWLSLDNSIYLNGHNLIASNTNATYQWFECSSEYIPLVGETNQIYTPVVNGNYALQITENGCIDTSECLLINNVGLDSYFDIDNIFIYPNPTKGTFNILHNESIVLQEIEIYSSLGENVYQKKELSKNELKHFNLKLSNGIYFVKLTFNDVVYIKELVIEN
ncbi:MAG: T9SS type A sorting domain-containing protein [Flavobacteriales bacterium]